MGLVPVFFTSISNSFAQSLFFGFLNDCSFFSFTLMGTCAGMVFSNFLSSFSD